MATIALASEAEWLAIREDNIGGSEAAALFSNWQIDGQVVTRHAYEDVPDHALYLGSCSPYTNAYAVYLAKTGKIMPADFSGERVQAGSFLEPAIASWAGNKWDWKLRKVRRYSTHGAVPGWGASVDYEVHGPGMDPVEIKNVDGLIADRNWIIEGDEVVAPPLHITIQLQHYVAARDAARGWIVACVGGNRLVRGQIARHEPTARRIADAITSFWQGVNSGTPPTRFAEFDAVAEEFAFGTPNSFIDLSGDDDAGREARRYMRIKAHHEFVSGVLDNIKARVAVKIGGNSRAKIGAMKVTWPVIESEARLVPARQQEARTYRGAFTVSIPKPKKPKKEKAS